MAASPLPHRHDLSKSQNQSYTLVYPLPSVSQKDFEIYQASFAKIKLQTIMGKTHEVEFRQLKNRISVGDFVEIDPLTEQFCELTASSRRAYTVQEISLFRVVQH